GWHLVLGVERKEDLERALAALSLRVDGVDERLQAVDLGEVPAAVLRILDRALEGTRRAIELEPIVLVLRTGQMGVRTAIRDARLRVRIADAYDERSCDRPGDPDQYEGQRPRCKPDFSPSGQDDATLPLGTFASKSSSVRASTRPVEIAYNAHHG